MTAGVGRLFTMRLVGRRTYWRTASVVMASVQFNATQDRSADHYFCAGWERKWWGGKVLSVRELSFVKSHLSHDSRYARPNMASRPTVGIGLTKGRHDGKAGRQSPPRD